MQFPIIIRNGLLLPLDSDRTRNNRQNLRASWCKNARFSQKEDNKSKRHCVIIPSMDHKEIIENLWAAFESAISLPTMTR